MNEYMDTRGVSIVLWIYGYPRVTIVCQSRIDCRDMVTGGNPSLNHTFRRARKVEWLDADFKVQELG
jgi:hypothetical protein